MEQFHKLQKNCRIGSTEKKVGSGEKETPNTLGHKSNCCRCRSQKLLLLLRFSPPFPSSSSSPSPPSSLFYCLSHSLAMCQERALFIVPHTVQSGYMHFIKQFVKLAARELSIWNYRTRIIVHLHILYYISYHIIIYYIIFRFF